MSDIDALHYRKNSESQYSSAHEIIDQLSLRGDETLIDVGCGDGRITAELAARLPRGRVIGVDPSPAMIALARTSFPHLTFLQTTAEELAFHQAADIVLAMSCVHWMRDPKKAFQKMVQALKPSGSLSILTYPKPSIWWECLDETLAQAHWRPFSNQSASSTILTADGYRAIVRELGLTVESTLEEKVDRYPSVEAVIAYTQGWIHCYLPLPEKLQAQFLKEASERAKRHMKGGEIHLPYNELALRGEFKV